jgi:TolA-binding protein
MIEKIKIITHLLSVILIIVLFLTIQSCSYISIDFFGSKPADEAEIEEKQLTNEQPANDNKSDSDDIMETGNTAEKVDPEINNADNLTSGKPEVAAGDAGIEELRSYFTQAVEYFEDGSYLLAEYCLNKIKDDYIIIQDHIYYYLAKSLLMQEKYNQAEEYYLKLIENYPDSIWVEKASIEYADVFYIKEDYATAESEYDKFQTTFPDSTYKPYCLFQLAYCQEKNGKKEAAFNNYKEIWLKYPLNEYSDYSLVNLNRIADEDPLIEPFIPEANQLFARGGIFFDAYQYNNAMDEYNRILQEDYSGSLTQELHSKTLFQIGMCYYRLLDYSHARDYLIRAYEKSPSGSIADDSLYFTAMALTNLNATDDAISYYQRLVKLFPSSNFSDDALYRIGRIYSQRGDFTNAASYFKRVHTEYPSGDKLADALWELGLIQYRAGDYSSARATFSSYASSHEGTQLGEKGLFWTAKCSQKMGENNTAASLYQKIVNLNSYSYYTFAAAEMLKNMNISVEIKKINNNLNPENPGISNILPDVYSILEEENHNYNTDENNSDGHTNISHSHSHINKAIEFLKLGFLNSASLEIEAGKKEIEESPSKILGIATLYFKSSNYSNSINMIGKNFKKLKSILDKNHTDYLYYLYYPYGFKEYVQKYSSQYNVDPLFILAVIRQESNFMPDAISYAGARGLMQIMPSTGESIARQLGISNYNVNMLTDPDINIKMGTFYLRQQLDNFNQNKFYCAGAYNGGPGRMSGWVSDRGNMDIDEFIESITYEQTREYVKRVIGNYYFYQMLYGN